MKIQYKLTDIKRTLIKTAIVLLAVIVPASVIFAENIDIQADKQAFDGEKAVFEGNVKVDYSDITIKSPKAIVRNDENGEPMDATFVDGAHAVKKTEFSRREIKANIINLSLLKNRVRAEGKSVSSVFEDKEPVVSIIADSQIFDINTNVIVATGNVNINYKEIKTFSDKARISLDEEGELKKVEFLDNTKIHQGGNIITADKVIYDPVADEMIASGNTNTNTILGDESKVSVWADYQQYDNESMTMITSGNVKIIYKNYVATGPKATFIPEGESKKPNKIYFIGRSKIKEGQRFVEADRIQMTLDPKNFKAEGNVKTRFTEVKSYKKMKKKK